MTRQADHYDPLDGAEPTEPALAHDVVRRTVPAGEPWAGREWEECRRCGARGDVGSIDPHGECSAVSTVGARTDSMLGVPLKNY